MSKLHDCFDIAIMAKEAGDRQLERAARQMLLEDGIKILFSRKEKSEGKGPSPWFLFAIVVAAKRSGDRLLERQAKTMLDSIYGIKISFPRNPKATKEPRGDKGG